MWNYVAKAKADGLVRHVGFSMHDGPETLEEILTAHPEVDFVQLQVNYLDWDDPVTQSARCMEVAAAHGKPVIIMEPVRGGRLANLPERGAAVLAAADPDASQASWAYRLLPRSAGRAHGARRRLHARADAGQHGHLPKPHAADGGGARRHRRCHRGPAQRGSHPVHELRLLRKGLPRGREDPHRHEPAEPGAHLPRTTSSSRASTLGRPPRAPRRSASSAAPARPCAPSPSASSTTSPKPSSISRGRGASFRREGHSGGPPVVYRPSEWCPKLRAQHLPSCLL